MTAGFRDRPAGLLTRHFFQALFDFGVFTQEGADAFVRTIIGLSAFIISLGFLLVYMYAYKYAVLTAAATGEPYAQAMLADTTLALALPMWIVAVVAVLASQSLFPDETDYRVLIPLPIGQGIVFGAKLLALALFAGLFTLTTHVALTPLVMRILTSRWAVDSLPLGVLTYWVVGPVASAFSLLAVVAANGLIVTCTPRARVHAISGAVRTAMLGALVLMLPLVLALPTQSVALARQSRLLLLAPPAWFMGVTRVMLGHRDPYFILLAQIAASALVSVAVVAFASYVVLYRRFDRVMLHALAVRRRRRRFSLPVTNVARAAVRDFTAATLGRSALHQGVVVGLSACGIGFALNSLIRGAFVGWLQGVAVPLRDVLGAVAWVPFPLIVVLGLAARASLALPIEPKANWIFRLTEHDFTRADELHAAERMIALFAAGIPAALTLPLQWLVAGPRSIVASAITVAFGLLWTEVLLRDWRRIPFTCSYMPGKQTVAQTFMAGLFIFLFVGTIGALLEFASLRGRITSGLVTVGVLLAIVLVRRRHRRRVWQAVPLLFDDELPSDVQVFGLSDA